MEGRVRTLFLSALALLCLATTLAAQSPLPPPSNGGDPAPGQIIVKFRTPNPAASQALALQDPDIVSAEFVGQSGDLLLLRSRARNVIALLEAYARRPDVVYARPNYLERDTASLGPAPTLISLSTAFGAPGSAVPVTLAGTQFASPMTISAGGSINVTDINVVNSTTATATFNIDAGASGSYINVSVTTAGGTSSNLVFWIFPTIPTISQGQTISGSLDPTDGYNAADYTHADAYKLTLSSSTQIAVDLRSNAFAPQLYIVRPSGSIYAYGSSGAGYAQTNFTLTPGTYYIEAASSNAGTGAYTISINVLPALTFMAPPFGVVGTSVPITLNGNRLVSPLTINAGSGITASNVNVTNSTFATATLNVPGNATIGKVNVSVTTPAGTSNPMPFSVFPTVGTISPGQTISGSLDTTDGINPYSSAYADLYQLNLPFTTQVTIDVRSSAEIYPTIYLLTSNGSFLSSGNTGSTYAQLNASLNGTYYVLVSSSFTGVTSAYTASINVLPALSGVSPAFGTPGAAVAVSLTGSRFDTPMTIATPAGITAANVNVANATTASATFNVAANANLGLGNVTVSTPAGTSNPVTYSLFPSIPTISPGQLISASLDTTDGFNPWFTSSRADLYQLTLASSTQVTIDQRSDAFQTLLYLLSPTGSIVAFSTNGNSYSQIKTTLAAGTYYIDASTTSFGATGAYTISINVLPVLTSISPPFMGVGTPVPVTLTGDRFSSPMTVTVGKGITATNVNVVNSTTATATFNVPPDTIPGNVGLTVTTPTGSSNSISFVLFPSIPSITAGQSIPASLDTTDGFNPFNGSAYADMYQLTLASSTQLTIDLRSDVFPPQLYLLSSTGSIVFFDTSRGSTYSQLSATVAAGTYYVDASTTAGLTIGAYTISINVLPVISTIVPVFGAAGSAVPVTLTGNRFVAPMTVAGSSGITGSNVNVGNSTSATATLNIPADAPTGTATVTVTTAAGSSLPVSFSVYPSIPTISPGQSISGSLDTTDGLNPLNNGAYADLYQLTIASTTQVTIDLRSTAFSTLLYLLSSSGSNLFSATNGGTYSQINATLSAGTYYVDVSSVTSGATGAYTISINVLPAISSISPPFGLAGMAVPVTLTGKRFVAPMTIDAGAGITVTNVNVTNSTTATATFTLAADITPGAATVTATTSTGASNPVSFALFTSTTPISPGQLISASLDTTDGRDPYAVGSYADLYVLTLVSPIQLTIDIRSSSAFSPVFHLLTSNGSIFSFTNFSGPTFAQITNITLSPGTYYIDAYSGTNGATGAYNISINVLPQITAISPPVAVVGTAVPVTLSGNRFGAPMTVSVGSGITATDVNVLNAMTATATFNVPGSTLPGVTPVTATTSYGESIAAFFWTFPSIPSISPGQTISGSLDTTDGTSLSSAAFADLYQLTLLSTTEIILDLRSNAFTPRVALISDKGSQLASSTNQVYAKLSPGTYYVSASSSSAFVTGAYTLSLNVVPALTTVTPAFGIAGAAVPVTLTGNRFGAPMTVSVGSGVTATNVNVLNANSATATFNVPGGVTPGPAGVSITSSPNGSSNSVSFFTFPSIGSINPGQTIAGSLSNTDGKSPFFLFTYSDLYQLTLASTTDVTIDMRSSAYPPVLNLFAPNGSLVSPGTIGPIGAGFSQITATLSAGTYYVDASTNFGNATGAYTLSINVLPVLSTLTPPFGVPGTAVPVAIAGTRFDQPLTVSVGSGVTVTDLNVSNATSATATFNVPGNASPGPATVTVTTPVGLSNGLSFGIFPSIVPISPGQIITADLATTDGRNPFSTSIKYADLYQLTLSSPTDVTIDLTSDSFNTFLYVLSSTGTLVASNDDSVGTFNSRIVMTLGAGTYYLDASSFLSGAVGPYTISIAGGRRGRNQTISQ